MQVGDKETWKIVQDLNKNLFAKTKSLKTINGHCNKEASLIRDPKTSSV